MAKLSINCTFRSSRRFFGWSYSTFGIFTLSEATSPSHLFCGVHSGLLQGLCYKSEMLGRTDMYALDLRCGPRGPMLILDSPDMSRKRAEWQAVVDLTQSPHRSADT